ncbi:MAG TPA: SRPBCC family protein [Solirubrobacteraceae bacterium]|nr:SRPBCC family protein [Solirubrobacteraceae bacterium]
MRCESTTTVARPPAEVFPWLIEPDKVRQWMTGLERYEPLDSGPLTVGSRIRQELVVSGQHLKFELHVVRLVPPSAAELRFEGSGFKAANEYTVTSADGAGAAVTWVISGEATSFKAKLIAPMVQAKLEEKLDTDLVRLRALLV